MYTYTTEELDAMSIVEMRSALRKSEQERERAEEIALILEERTTATLDDSQRAAHALLALTSTVSQATRFREVPELTKLRTDLAQCFTTAKVTTFVEDLIEEMQRLTDAAEPLLAPLDESRRSPYADLRHNLDQARTILAPERATP